VCTILLDGQTVGVLISTAVDSTEPLGDFYCLFTTREVERKPPP
jgi:hypothetical protein